MKMLKPHVILPLLFVLSSPLATSIDFAQAQQTAPPFKVGDRVEVDVLMHNDPEEARYKKGTVTDVNLDAGVYHVDVDQGPGQLPRDYGILIRDGKEFWMRHIPKDADVPQGAPAEKAHQQGVPAEKAHQQGAVLFKVGDRVEVDTRMPSVPDEAFYKKATVTAVDLKNGIYTVDVDGPSGQLPIESQILIRDDKPFWIRAIRKGADVPHNIPTEKLHVDQYDTVLPNRPLLNDNFNRKAKNGTRPSSALARKLVQSLIEHPASPGLDGAVTADIVSLTIGTPRRWVRNQDVGQGSVNTIVYPLHVKWNQKTFYRTRNVLITGKEYTFTYFVDNTHLWQCGYASGQQTPGHTQEILVVP